MPEETLTKEIPKNLRDILSGKKVCNTYQRLFQKDNLSYFFWGGKPDEDSNHKFEFILCETDTLKVITTIEGYYFPWITEQFRNYRGETDEQKQFRLYETYDVSQETNYILAEFFFVTKKTSHHNFNRNRMLMNGMVSSAHINTVETEKEYQNKGFANLAVNELLKMLPTFKHIGFVTLVIYWSYEDKTPTEDHSRWKQFFLKKGFHPHEEGQDQPGFLIKELPYSHKERK